MSKSFCIVVSDDGVFLQRAREWAFQHNVPVRCYTTQQWESNPESLPGQQPTVQLAGGANSSESGKVLPFPTGGRAGADGKRVATMDELESEAIKSAIMEFKGNLTEAAKALGIGRATLYRKVKQYNIDPSVARNRTPVAA